MLQRFGHYQAKRVVAFRQLRKVVAAINCREQSQANIMMGGLGFVPAASVCRKACVTDVPDDDLEDRLLLGKGFQSFIDCLAEGAKVQLDDPVKDWERGCIEAR